MNLPFNLDLGGKVEGVLPFRNQSPRETYHKNDRIKALITDLKPSRAGLQIILSRTDSGFCVGCLPFVFSFSS